VLAGEDDTMKIMFLNKAPKAVYDVTEIEKQLNSYTSPGTRVEVAFPDNFEGSQVEDVLGSQMMLNGLDHLMETPAIIRKIVWASENGYDAVIQSNTFDPGVDGGRLAVSIPVIGPFRTTIHMVANLVDRIGIIVPLPSHIPYTWRLLRTMGMDGFVTGIKTLAVYGPDIKKRRQEITEKTAGLVRALVDETGAPSGRSVDSLRRRPGGSSKNDRRTSLQHQGNLDPRRRDVRFTGIEPQPAHLSTGQTHLSGLSRQAVDQQK